MSVTLLNVENDRVNGNQKLCQNFSFVLSDSFVVELFGCFFEIIANLFG